MHITREADYAVRCVLHLASNTGRAVSVGEVAKRKDVPRQFAAKILQKLTKAGIVRPRRGAGGGYTLARDPQDITLLDVYETASGPLALNICAANEKNCDRSPTCPVHPVWVGLTEELAARMKSWDFRRLLSSGGGTAGRGRGGVSRPSGF